MKNILVVTLVLFTVAAAAQEKSKPVDVAVKQVNDRRTNGHFAQLAISLELPKVPTLEVSASRVLISRAVDETGRDLLDPEAQEPELETNHRAGLGGKADPTTPVTVSVTLKNPDRKATKVKEVRGEIELFMPGKDASSVAEIPKFLSLAGKPLTHKALKANGVEIALLTSAQIEAERKKRADAKKKEYAEMGFAGEDLENMIKNFMESLLGVQESEMLARVKDPKGRIQEISYIDAAGEVKPVMMREEEGMTLLSTWAGKPEPDWKMRISMKTPKNVVRYTFALNDVELP